MAALLAHNWWIVAMRGVAAILLGCMVFAVPGFSLFALILGFGGYTLLNGVVTIISALRGVTGERRWWSLLLEGLFNIAVGVLTFLLPTIGAQFILILIGVWGITTGVAEIRTAVHLRREIVGEWILGAGGVVSVLFGVLLMLLAGTGPVLVVALIGAYALLFGLLLIALAVRLRFAQPDPRRMEHALEPAMNETQVEDVPSTDNTRIHG